MSNHCTYRRTPALAVSLAMLLPGLSSLAANDWTNNLSALWRSSTNWSLTTAPNGTSNADPTQITNAVTKTVTVDSLTASVNLSLRGLTISAPVGSTNTLGLLNVPLGTPLTTSKPFLVGSRAILAITNSAVSAADSFDIAGGALILDSGSLNCAVNCDLQSGRMIVNSGTLNATLNPLLGTTGIRMGRFSGANASLVINGGTVTAPRITLGSVSGSQSSLTIAGGNLITPDSFSAGQQPATTASVTMTAGSLVVTNGRTKIADRSAASFSQSGGNTRFSDLSIGDLGVGAYNLSGGTFTVTSDNSDLCIIGNMEAGDFNQSGGVAVIDNEMHVADFDGISANLNIRGGQFFATNELVAIGRFGLGTMTVSNATAVLINTSIGRHLGANGTLLVQNNANLVFTGDLSAGRLAGASGSIQIEGGSLSVTNDDFWIGRGGTGGLTVTGGNLRAGRVHVGESDDGTNAPTGTLSISAGTFTASSNLVVGTPLLSSGQLFITGGQITVTNSTGSAFVQVNSGSASMTGGTLTADILLINNTNAAFTFNNGLIRAKAMTVANGQPFTVGDGINPATLELLGGTYTFANGLVISPNATVTGCGTVIGSITNNGTYNNPCGPGPALSIASITKSGNTAAVSFVSINSRNHTLEFKNALTNANWTPILPGLPGNGNPLTLTDPAATNATRFYRVHAQ